MRKLAYIFFISLFLFGCTGFDLDDLLKAQKLVRDNPTTHTFQKLLGDEFSDIEEYRNAIASYKKAIQIKPDYADAHWGLGYTYENMGRNNEAIKKYKDALGYKPNSTVVRDLLSKLEKKFYEEAILKNPQDATAHMRLGIAYHNSMYFNKAIASFKEAIRIKPNFSEYYYYLGNTYKELVKYGSTKEKHGYFQKAVSAYKEALRINPNNVLARNNLNELEQKIAQTTPAPPVRQATPQPQEKQKPQSGSGSGFFVSKMGHVITNAHVVKDCKRLTVGDNANKQVPAELINTDRSNDLALLKLSTLEMASADSKSLIQKLSIVVVPLASKGLLRNEDVRLGEKVLVAGYPFGDIFSNTIKVTSGIVSATRGSGDDSGQFQLDAAVQPGNSGGPIYDSSGNIVGVVVSQLNKRMVEKAIGSMPENVNFGIKASTVRQFLISSGVPSKKSEQTEEKSTQQLAEIAKNQALMVMCLQ